MLNTTDSSVFVPGYLEMDFVNQLQLLESIGAGGSGLIRRALVVDPGWKKAHDLVRVNAPLRAA
jgi:hypothetical protein